MTTRIKLRRDTAANWTTTNPILAAGEPGLETDTGKIKYGDGVSRWNVLEHTGGDTLINDSAITVQTGDADRWFVRLRREDNTLNPEYTGVVVNSTNYDSEGNAIVVATLGLNDGGTAIFKFTSAGELVWKKALESIDSTWWIDSNVVVDADDNIIFVVNPDSNGVKMIVKLNGETGAVIFSEVLLLNGVFDIKAIAVDSNSNIIIGGSFYFADNNTAFVAKLNSTADTVTWQHSFLTESNYSNINALEVDFNNDIIVAGYVNLDYQISGSTEQRETMLVAKITSAGTVGWQKAVALDDVDDGKVTGLSLDSLGNIYATGTYNVDNPTNNSNWNGSRKSNAVVIFKMTTLGSVVWDRRVGPGQCSWVGVSTAVGADGDLYLYASTYQYRLAGNVDSNLGYWNATLALARYNKATGAVIWQSYFDNPLAQEVPAWGNEAPWDNDTTDLMTVQGNKILIGGSVRFGVSDADFGTPWNPSGEYFNQGFLAQFDTDATPWSAEGWTLSTSHIPGKLTNTLAAVDSSLVWQNDIDLGNDGSANLETIAVGVSVRRTASKTNTWTFSKDGTFSAPEDANIKLNQKQLGYTGLYGLLNNNTDNIWFESVTHDADGFAYVLGSDQWAGNKAHIYKFSPDGSKVWQTQLRSGSGASFNIEWDGNVYTTATVNQGGSGYKVGDKIVLRGINFGGSDGVNSLTLTVATITNDVDNIGGVSTVTIVGGVAVDGSSSSSDVSDLYDDAHCDVRSIAFDPVTGNPVVMITTPTYNGDTLDNEWTQTVTLLIDSGSGAVLSTTTLSDEGDIYANDIAVSSTGVPAVVGEKYNEYNEYGAITPLSGSGFDEFWVLKSDIDAEHFPGELNGNVSDWWITGTDITDQAQIFGVNDYQDLDTTVRQGSGATFNIINNGNGTYSAGIETGGTNYLVGHKIQISGSAIGGVDVTNDITITVDSITGSGIIDGVSNTGTAAGGGDPSGKSFSETGSPPSFDGTNTISFSGPRSQMLGAAWSSFTIGDSISFVVDGITRTTTISQITGSNADPMNPIPYTLVVSSGGAPSGTVTLFTVSDLSGLAQSSYTTGPGIIMAGGPNPNDLLTIGVPISDANLAAKIASIPNGATIMAYTNMFGSSEFTLTSAFTLNESNNRWEATFFRESGSDSSFIGMTVIATAGGGSTSYNELTGTNYQVGSGYVVDIDFSAVNGTYTNWSTASSGQNYVVGDILTVSGTQFAGGAITANDITFRVAAVSGGLVDSIDTITGTIPSTHLLLSTDYGVNFAPGENSFSIKQNLGGEAFIWTPTFTKAIGGNNFDWFTGVVWNAAGTSVYAVGTGRYDVTYDQALVVKFSSTGTVQASKFINGDMSSNGADKGAVALMANDSIVVVHRQYNPYRDEVNEILVTKLNSDLAIVWQQFIGVQDNDGDWEEPSGQIGVAVDPASDEILITWIADEQSGVINDDAMHLLKLDTDGEVLWKRIFGIHESDSYYGFNGNGNKFLSIQGDKFTIVGYTQGPGNEGNDNAWIATLPLDGTGVGKHGFWTYAEPNDDKIKVWRLSNRTSTTFTPNVHSGAITNAFNVKYYYTDYPIEEFTFYPHVIRSNQGGAIEFADGSKQTFSTALIPQVRIGEGRYIIRPEDSGRHILVEDANYAIRIPNWQKVTLPVGFTFTIVNISNSSVDVETEYADGYQGELWISGADTKTDVVGIDDNGSGQMVTLIKIKEGTTSDDGDNHGDIWMIAGADIYNNN